MSQLSIGIGIRLDISGGLSAGAEEVEFVEHNAFSPRVASAQADTNPEWTLLTGRAAGIQQTNARWYPAKTTNYTGVRWSTLPVPLLTNDNYMQVEAIESWTNVNDWIGPALRMSDTQASFYGFLVDGDDNYVIRRTFEGSESDEKSGALGVAIVPGSIIRIEVSGDTVSCYIDGNLIDTYTDVNVSKNTTGDPGIIAEGLGTSNGIVNFRAGDLASEGNLAVFGDYAWRPKDDRHYVGSCLDGDDAVDGVINTASLHIAAAHPHWIEIDFLDFRVPSRIRNHGATAAYYDWDDVDILTKVNIGDDWTEVATGLDLDNDGIDGWKSSGDFAIIQPCRYVRIEINSTLYGGDGIGSEEVQFLCISQP